MARRRHNDKSTTFENGLLHDYWDDVKGLMYLEVPVGNRLGGHWPKGSKVRRIDAVRVPVEDPEQSGIIIRSNYKLKDLSTAFRDKNVEVIEVKRKLNRLVFGQAVAGADVLHPVSWTQLCTTPDSCRRPLAMNRPGL